MALPIITVFGATGKQGGGVVAALLAQQHEFPCAVRGVCRDPRSAAALRLVAQGVEMVAADVSHVSESEGDDGGIARAVAGSAGVFASFDFWTLGFDKEVAAGKAVVDAARREPAMRHFVFSSLEPMGDRTNGRLAFGAFDSKARIVEHLERSGLPFTLVKYATYCENFVDGHTRLQRSATTGAWRFEYALGGAGLTLVPVHDAGRVVARIFAQRERYLGRSIGLAGDHLTLAEMAATFGRVTGEAVETRDVPLEELRAAGAPSLNMWIYKREFEQEFAEYVAQSRAIVPDLLSFEQWLRLHWPTQAQSQAQ